MVKAGEGVIGCACPGRVHELQPGKPGERGLCGLPDPVTEQPQPALTGLRWR